MTQSSGLGDGSRLKWLLAFVAATRLLFALAVWITTGATGFQSPDTDRYLTLARLLLHGSFSDPRPEIYRTPGYPLLLLPAVASGHPIFVGVLENILLSILCAWLVWKIVRELSPDSSAAAWAVIFYCFEPVGILYSVQLMSEMLFCAFFLFFLWLLVRYLKNPTPLAMVFPALALAGTAYARPVSLYLVLWLLPLLLFLPRTLSWPRRLVQACILPAVFVLALMPWIVRNTLVADYKGFSSSGDFNLYFQAAAAVEARQQHKSFRDTQDALGSIHYFEVYPERRNWSQGQITKVWHDESRRIIFSHLPAYLVIHAKGCLLVMFDSAGTLIAGPLGIYPVQGGNLMARLLDQGMVRGTIWLFRQYPATASLYFLLELLLLAYYVMAIKGLRRLPREIAFLLVYLSAYLVLVSGIPGALARYRAPIMPTVCVAAAVAIASRTVARASVRSRQPTAPAVLHSSQT
jgi:4-amino-4-deoxy-L-arabinose transferase-like glycosyltransferase